MRFSMVFVGVILCIADHCTHWQDMDAVVAVDDVSSAYQLSHYYAFFFELGKK